MDKIALIAPDEQLYILANDIAKRYSEPIKVVLAMYDDCVLKARDLVREGYKVLISRGGVALKIRNSINIPIIDIAVSDYNVVSLLAQARNYSNEIAVVGFHNLISGAKEVAPIIGVKIRSYEVKADRDLASSVAKAKKDGATVLVGGYQTVKYGEDLGIKGFYIKSRPVEVKKAIEEAEKVLSALDREREWGELLRIILDSVQEGVISIDRKGKVTHYNGMVRKLIANADILSEKPIENILATTKLKDTLKFGLRSFDDIHEISGHKFTSNTVPIEVNKEIVGAIAILQEVGYIQSLEQKVRKRLYQKGYVAKSRFSDILGESAVIKETIQRAKQYSKVDSTILIYGESGTGKEMFAQSIHNSSYQSDGPFVAINCAAIPNNLLESELFGYVEGAFSGAKRSGKIGLFELAHNGTIFLDEIGEISLDMQAKLLRVLEEKQIMRIGDDKVIPINVRVIAATNKDLRSLVKKAVFREDLFYRLNVLTVTLAPLRGRKEDIPIFTQYFLNQFSLKYNKNMPDLLPDGMQVLLDYNWPGNIRELKNVIERLVITSKRSSVGYKEVMSIMEEALDHLETTLEHLPMERGKLGLVEKKEKELIQKVLTENSWNKSKAAQELGISRSTLYRRIKQDQ